MTHTVHFTPIIQTETVLVNATCGDFVKDNSTQFSNATLHNVEEADTISISGNADNIARLMLGESVTARLLKVGEVVATGNVRINPTTAQ